jgi:hypothetical protein
MTRPEPYERFAWAVDDLCQYFSATASNGGASVYSDSAYDEQIISLRPLTEVVHAYDVVLTDGSICEDTVSFRFVNTERLEADSA